MGDEIKIAKLRKELRQALGDYVYSEGCTCCQDTKKHEQAAERLAKLLNVAKYTDGSGYDFYRYATNAKKDAGS